MTRCHYCNTELPNPKPRQRFCSHPGATCRQRWHREQDTGFPGYVYRIAKTSSGEYTVTVRLPAAPVFNKGDRVSVAVQPRPDASTQIEQGDPEQ